MTWYTGDATYDTLLAAGLITSALVALAGFFVQSPYGRFASGKYGVALGPRLGWFLMELPAPISFCVFFFQGRHRAEVVPLVFLGMFLVHYANRGYLFPYLIRAPKGAKTSFSLMVVSMGWVVTSLHGYFFGWFIAELGTHYTTAWLADPRFLAGLALYYGSFALNIHSDAIVRNLRTKAEVAAGEKVYRVPRGGLFRWVSSPSYLTELTAWAGFALCTWSLGAVFVLAISLANLVPRAFATHRWYRERFADYPPERKALIPFVL
jgi:3-oxo-5-alpha-steroid 4-dehydrogenase 1